MPDQQLLVFIFSTATVVQPVIHIYMALLYKKRPHGLHYAPGAPQYHNIQPVKKKFTDENNHENIHHNNFHSIYLGCEIIPDALNIICGSWQKSYMIVVYRVYTFFV